MPIILIYFVRLQERLCYETMILWMLQYFTLQ